MTKTGKGDAAASAPSAGSSTHLRRRQSSTPTRPRWPGSGTHTQPCHRLHGPWSVPSRLVRSVAGRKGPGQARGPQLISAALPFSTRCCTSLTAGGMPHSTLTPASSSPPSLASQSSWQACLPHTSTSHLVLTDFITQTVAAVASAQPTLTCFSNPQRGQSRPSKSYAERGNSPEPNSRTWKGPGRPATQTMYRGGGLPPRALLDQDAGQGKESQ